MIKGKVKIIVNKDWNGYLAEVEGSDNLYAFGYTEIEAKNELVSVLEMMIDYNSEQLENQKNIKKYILNEKELNYAL